MMCYLLNLSQWDYKMVHLLLSLKEEDLMSSFFSGAFTSFFFNIIYCYSGNFILY